MKTEPKNWTWKEFKRIMDDLEVKDSDRIWYIDINIESSYPIHIAKDHFRGVEVTNYPDM